jgi:geranylgeranyl diphosphate synthase type II
MNFKDVLAEKKALVWAKIQHYIPNDSENPYCTDIADRYAQENRLHWEMVTDYPRRQGKYVRPSLLLLSCEALGTSQEQALLTAAAMQTSEDWILVHDDIEDDSMVRRGKPTLHRLYGSALALNAGDTLHLIMWRMLFDNYEVLGPSKAKKVVDEFYHMLLRTHLGQAVEIMWAREASKEFDDADVDFVMTGKAAYYTIAGPLRLGAVIADATPQQLVTLLNFGRCLGKAFQITDDILDVTSDFDGQKTQMGNDIIEGKRTVLLFHLLKNASESERQQIRSILIKPRCEKTFADVYLVIDLMKKHGSIAYARERARALARDARAIFDGIDFFTNLEARENLLAGVAFMVERTG